MSAAIQAHAASHSGHTALSHDPHAHDAQGHGSHHATPLERLTELLRLDRSDLWLLLTYTVLTGIFALAVPLAAQALVNTIAAGLSYQPLIVLTALVGAGLTVAGVLKLLQLSLVEILQQRIFARVALNLGERLPRIRQTALANEYPPELVNRFFDTLTIQKTAAKILLDGLAAALQAIVGLILIAFYSPFLLLFGIFMLASFAFITFGLGVGGLRTSIGESVQKYKVAEWLEELARCHVSFKMDGVQPFLTDRTDQLVLNYIRARRAHFAVVWRQAIGNYLFQAIASAGTLGIGGWLVINRQLTLGQLVAAELIVVAVLAALDKLIRLADVVYDLLTALDKVGHVTDLPIERQEGRYVPAAADGAAVRCRDVHFSHLPNVPVLKGLDLLVERGQRVSLVGASGAGKTTLATLICGLEEPSQGSVEVNGIEVRAANLCSLRELLGLVSDENEIFEGPLEDNVAVGRPHVTHEDVRWALELVQLTDDIARMPAGVRTVLISSGRNLSHGQRQRLLLARAIAARPRLLILDEAFTGIDDRTKLKILDALYSPENPWTIIDISHDAEVVARSSVVHVLCGGRIVESGAPEELARRAGSEFASLFPELAHNLSRQRTSASRRSAARTEPTIAPA